MPQQRSPFPFAPQPTKVTFDPFNSSSTGHQRAENRLSGSTSWRDSRTYKLSHQLRDRSGRGGDRHLSDLVGAGSENFGKDGRRMNGHWEPGAPRLREEGWQDIRGLIGRSTKRKHDITVGSDKENVEGKRLRTETPSAENSKVDGGVCAKFSLRNIKVDETHESEKEIDQQSPSSSGGSEYPQIFKFLNLYLNGSTAPLVSDHRLKQLWVQHGGEVSIGLGRRTVTHVILGEGISGGGGLASSKIQKEVTRVRGKGIKYVNVKWVLDSIEKGRKLSEAGYSVAEKTGGARQTSVKDTFAAKGKKNSTGCRTLQ